MKSAYLTCVLALILALRTGVSRGQCEKCDCDGPRVKCSGKQLSTIPLSLPNATVLNLSNNTLASLPDGAFEGWQKLTELSLNDNKITFLHDDAFKGLTNLKILYLDRNKITFLHDDAFKGLTNLAELWLQGNELGNLSGESFKSLTRLQELKLTSNDLKTTDDGVFKEVPNLDILYLNVNRINPSRESFKGLTQLQSLFLAGNQLTSLHEDAFKELPNLRSLYLRGNPLICDCQLRWLIEKVHASQSDFTVSYANCSEPAHLQGRDLVNVPQADLTCSTQANDVDECALNPCKYGATCNNLQNDYSCVCSPGWQGKNCDQACTDGTFGNNCEQTCGYCNVGVCSPVNGQCQDSCKPGYSGPLCKEQASTSQAPESKPTVSSTTESSTFVYISIGLGVGLVVVITVAVIVIMKLKRRRRNTPTPTTFTSQLNDAREYQPLADRGLVGREYDRIADRDVHSTEYDDVEIVAETSLQSNVPQYRAPQAAYTMVT